MVLSWVAVLLMLVAVAARRLWLGSVFGAAAPHVCVAGLGVRVAGDLSDWRGAWAWIGFPCC